MSLTSKIKGFERKEIGILQWSILAATLFCVQKRVAFLVEKMGMLEGSLNAGHVTLKITFSSILRFSYVCTSA